MKQSKIIAIIVAVASILAIGFGVYYCTNKGETPKTSVEWYNLEKVYISTGRSAKRFHANRNCPGLKKCKHIEEVSLDDAMKLYDRTPCKLCCQESESLDK